MKIAAFDLSLTATGVAIAYDVRGTLTLTFETLSPDKLTGMERLRWIKTNVLERCNGVDLVVFEGLAHAAHDKDHERAGLAYLIRYALWSTAHPFVLVAPTSLKKFVTGKGNGEKSLIIREVYRRWGCEVSNDNEADACVLAVIGKCLMGDHEPETTAQREVIATLRKGNELIGRAA